MEDLGDDVWNFMSFCKKDFVKDSVPDKQLSLQELTLRYKGELTNGALFDPPPKKSERCCHLLEWRVSASATLADTKKSVLKTIANMDLDKINMDLVEDLLEWIVDGKHNYPPGKNPDPFSSLLHSPLFIILLPPPRRCSGFPARPG